MFEQNSEFNFNNLELNTTLVIYKDATQKKTEKLMTYEGYNFGFVVNYYILATQL